ncbi:hypothetical protein BDW67DRAFT_176657 [Aspergillus spinulosporus]
MFGFDRSRLDVDNTELQGKLGRALTSYELEAKKYTVLRVLTSLSDYPTATDRELRIYKYLATCLVQQLINMILLKIIRIHLRLFDLPLLKMTVERLLLAPDFLHAEAEDTSMLADLQPRSPRKVIDQSHIIYRSRNLPVLGDFGKVRISKTEESGLFVQLNIYQALENLAGLIWDLFKGRHLFGDIYESSSKHDPSQCLVLMVALFGPPHIKFMQCSNWINYLEVPVPSVLLEAIETRLTSKEKERFLAFIRAMLKWMPEECKTARQLLESSILALAASFPCNYA